MERRYAFAPLVYALLRSFLLEYHPDDDIEEKNDKQKTRLEKRKRVLEELAQLREEFFKGDWDGLVGCLANRIIFSHFFSASENRLLISSEYEPYSIIEALEPLLTGSANIIVHHPQIQV